MAIAFEVPPPQSEKELEEGLARLGLVNLLLAGDGTAPSKPSPHQVHALRLDRLAEEGPLEEAELLSWRYIVGGTPGSLLSADVRVASAEEHVFSAFSQNRIANEMLAQLDRVTADEMFSRATFNPRLLRVFGLMFAALWLHRPEAEDFKDDIFIPLPGASDPLTAGEKYFRNDLAKALHEEAKQQIELVTDTSS